MLETYSKYPNIPNKHNIFMIGSRVVPGLKQRHAGPKKPSILSFSGPELNLYFRVGSVCFFNPDIIFMPKRNLRKSVHIKYQIN